MTRRAIIKAAAPGFELQIAECLGLPGKGQRQQVRIAYRANGKCTVCGLLLLQSTDMCLKVNKTIGSGQRRIDSAEGSNCRSGVSKSQFWSSKCRII